MVDPTLDWNPKPETRKPKTAPFKPEPRNTKHETRNTKPGSQNPKPETRIPKHESRNLKPETRNQVYKGEVTATFYDEPIVKWRLANTFDQRVCLHP
jgi:hypothetical protein